MAEMRVQCPNCQAKMKLTAAIEKVRCPKCDELFIAAENRVRSAKPKTARSAPKQQQSSADVFGFEEADNDDDLSGETPPRKKRAQPASKSSRSKRSSKPKSNAIPPEQLRKFGGTMILIGIGAFILPFVGLQIKGLNAMSPEMQSLGGVCFLILGAVIIAISYLENLGPVFDNGFQIVKWGAIGVFALIFGGIILLVGGRFALNAMKGGGNNQPDIDRMAQQMHEDAMQRHNDTVQQMQQTHRDMINATNNTSASQPNQFQPTNSQQSTTQSSDPSSPFQDVTHFPSSNEQGGNTSNQVNSTTSPNSPRNYQGSGFGIPNAQNSSNTQTGSQTVTVFFKGFNRGEVMRHRNDIQAAAETFRVRPSFNNDGSTHFVVDAVKDIQQFADRIHFGKVTKVDSTKNEITLEQ